MNNYSDDKWLFLSEKLLFFWWSITCTLSPALHLALFSQFWAFLHCQGGMNYIGYVNNHINGVKSLSSHGCCFLIQYYPLSLCCTKNQYIFRNPLLGLVSTLLRRGSLTVQAKATCNANRERLQRRVPGFQIVFFMGRWGSLGLLTLLRSLRVFQGLWESFLLFLLRVFQGPWNRTCFYLNDPQRLNLCGSLWVTEGGWCRSFSCVSIWSFTIFHGLSKNCATLSNLQRLYGNQALELHELIVRVILEEAVPYLLCKFRSTNKNFIFRKPRKIPKCYFVSQALCFTREGFYMLKLLCFCVSKEINDIGL